MNIDATTSPDQLRALAVAARNQQDWDTAVFLLRELTKREPRNAEAWRELAVCRIHQHQAEHAIPAMRKAVTLAPKDATLRQEYAAMLMQKGEYGQALAQSRQAIAMGAPDPAACWVSIGQIHERMHKLDLAREAARKAVEIDPGSFQAMELLGGLARRDGRLDEAERLYRRALELAREPEHKAKISQALGTILEKLERWDDAFEAYRWSNHTLFATPRAKVAMRHGIPPYRKIFGDPSAGAYYQRWAARPEPDDHPSPMILAGFPRSGTTMTEQVIASLDGVRTTDEHPFMSPVEERAMAMIRRKSPPPDSSFIEQLDALTPGELSELRTIYWNGVWREVGTEARDRGERVLDKHPMRTLDLGMVNLLFPRAKVVVMIRDPRDCCLSCFFQDLGITPVSVRFLTLETLGDIYGEIMGLWVGMRDRVTFPWLEMRYEDLVSDFEPRARELVEFLGEPWTDRVLEFHKKAARRTITTPSYQAVTQKVNTRAVGRWARYEKHLGPLVERVRPFLDTFGYEI